MAWQPRVRELASQKYTKIAETLEKQRERTSSVTGGFGTDVGAQ
jgi:hypothetical protein